MAKVLVVDDESALLQSYSRILGAEGCEVLQADTGETALQVCRDEYPDLVLLDAMLPDLPGLEVCRRIKADPGLKHVSVLMISGRKISGDDQADGLDAGADGFLTKPIERRSLVAHVRALLRIRSAERELRESEERQRRLVDDLLEANRRLEEYNRLKAEFVANMSHELRTPLTAIIGFAQLIEMSERDKPLLREHSRAFEKILRNGRHLLALIDDVLDIAKIEAGRMRIHREHFEVVEVIQDAFGELQSLARQKEIQYLLRVPGELPLAFSDPLRLRQVVINLLSNAIKFTDEGSVLAELLPWGEREFRFQVSDTGVGIEEKAMGIIFERFRQVDGSMSRLAGGAGLGLAIVKQIGELLGGRIEVGSKPGDGSTFTVTLPFVAPDPDHGSPEPAVSFPPLDGSMESMADALGGVDMSDAGNGGRPLVLVVEDDPDSASLLSETLAAAGYQVRVAGNGPHGLELARELQPSAITLDIMMPGMDGWRVLQALKAEPRTAQIPVIVCSIVDNRALGYRLGASAYLIKPVQPDQLTESLRTVSGIVSGSENGKDGYVLVIDDEYGVRELLTTALRRGGFEVRSAPSGETALRILSQAVPQAILVDLMMPNGMSGFEFIARLRSDPRTEDVPILVVTGRDITPDDRQFIRGQITEVIRKGDLLMSDLELRLRETLEQVGVLPSHGENPAG
ncbi:MAG TPA: response regulator [Thermoanaerobaculia bacterium]|nr:response regulator [Thermoanaerobaculia bacterium]